MDIGAAVHLLLLRFPALAPTSTRTFCMPQGTEDRNEGEATGNSIANFMAKLFRAAQAPVWPDTFNSRVYPVYPLGGGSHPHPTLR